MVKTETNRVSQETPTSTKIAAEKSHSSSEPPKSDDSNKQASSSNDRVEILKKRAERFGIVSKQLDEQLLKERASRFGVISPKVEEIVKKQRLERFSKDSITGSTPPATAQEIQEEQEKRRLRAERFKLSKTGN